jgi:hypothetical protein
MMLIATIQDGDPGRRINKTGEPSTAMAVT